VITDWIDVVGLMLVVGAFIAGSRSR